MTDTILILGANSLQLPLINKANNLGYKTLVVSPVASEPGHKIAAFSEFCDVVDEECVLEIAKRYDVSGIITDQTDLPVFRDSVPQVHTTDYREFQSAILRHLSLRFPRQS